MAGQRKSLTGTVVSDKMDKTVVVVVETTTRHRLYHKILKRSRRYLAHDDRFDAKPGDLVRILETRPLSRHKRWRVVEILQRGEVAEIAPQEIDAEYLTLQRERQAPPEPAPKAAAPEGAEAAEEPQAEPSEGELPVETEEPAAEEEEAPIEAEEAGEAEPAGEGQEEAAEDEQGERSEEPKAP